MVGWYVDSMVECRMQVWQNRVESNKESMVECLDEGAMCVVIPISGSAIMQTTCYGNKIKLLNL